MKKKKEGSPRLKGPLRLRATFGATGLKHDGGIRVVAAAPSNAFFVSCGDGDELHLWDPRTGDLLADIKGTDRGVYALCLSRDERLAFVGGHELQIFDLVKQKRIAALPVKKPLVVAVAASANVVLFGDDRRPRRFDIKTRTELPEMKGHLSRIDACAISADETRAVTCGGDRKIKLHAFDGKKPAIIATLEGYGKKCGFAPDGRTAWSVGWDHVRFFDATTTGKVTWELGDRLTSARTAALSNDGRLFAVAYEEEILVFALPSKKAFKRIPVRDADTIAFDHDGKRLLAGNDGHGMGEGSGIEVFDVEAEKRVLPTDDGHIGGVHDLAIPRDRPQTLMSVGVDMRVLLWDIETGQAFEQLGPLSEQGCAIAVTSDGGTIVTTSTDGRTLVWNVSATTSRSLPTEKDGRGAVDVAVSPDDRTIAFAPYTPGQAVLFDLDPKKAKSKPLILKGHKAQMCAVAFSPDGSRLFTASADEKVIAWSLPSANAANAARVKTKAAGKGKGKIPEQLFTITCHGFVNAIAIVPRDASSKGKRASIVTGTTYGEIAVFDAETGKRECFLRKEGGEISHMVPIAATGSVVVVRSGEDWESTVIEIWNLDKEKLEASADLSPLKSRGTSACVSPDGQRLCVGTSRGTILVFERT